MRNVIFALSMVLSALYLGMMTGIEVSASGLLKTKTSPAERYLEEADQRPGVFRRRDGSFGVVTIGRGTTSSEAFCGAILQHHQVILENISQRRGVKSSSSLTFRSKYKITVQQQMEISENLAQMESLENRTKGNNKSTLANRVLIESKNMRIGCAGLEKERGKQFETQWTFKFEGKNVGFADVLRDFDDPKYGSTEWFTSFEKSEPVDKITYDFPVEIPVFEVILWSRLKAWR